MSQPAARSFAPQTIATALSITIAAVFGLRFWLAGRMNLNWDEFYFLAKIYAHQRGDLVDVLVTFHVRLFWWLPQLAGNEVDQILVGRRFVFVIQLASAFLVYRLGLRLYGRTAALYAVFAGTTLLYCLRHGEALRSDALLSFLFLAACAMLVLQPGRRWSGLIAGTVLALACLISTKALLLLPAVALLALAQWRLAPERGALKRQLLAAAGALVLGTMVLYGLHGSMISPEDMTQGPQLVVRQAGRFLTLTDLLPLKRTLFTTMRWDFIFWGLLFGSLLWLTADVVRGGRERRWRAVRLLAFVLPLASVVFYRGAYAYHYVTVLPSACLVVGLGVCRLEKKLRRRPALFTTLVALLVVVPIVQSVRFARLFGHDSATLQREVLQGVRDIFPEPVRYIDRCSMVAGFPKIGPFMTHKNMKNYQSRGLGMRELLTENHPLFVLANIAALDLRRPWRHSGDESHRLPREDFLLLKRNFIPHWGPVYVPGKRFRGLRGKQTEFEILIPGTYTLESSSPVHIDERRYESGDTVELAPGEHRLVAGRSANLRWSHNLPRPGAEAPTGPVFEDLNLERLIRELQSR